MLISPTNRPTVLLTGFGPFPSVGANATSILVPPLAEAARAAFPGVRIESCILPTEWAASLNLLEALLDDTSPAVALHFGVSGRATGFEIETRGRNACSLSEDAAGLLPIDSCISAEGPDFLPATIPASHIVTQLRRRGLPAQISRDAGGYLCNALLYRSLELARRHGRPQRTGFVHLPATLVSERRPEREPRALVRLDWSGVIEGGLEIIRSTLGRPHAPAPESRRRQPLGTATSGRRGMATHAS
ncbi:MAG: pyroglutamyl-peptidase I [Hyphomicrobiaceae bacterium]